MVSPSHMDVGTLSCRWFLGDGQHRQISGEPVLFPPKILLTFACLYRLKAAAQREKLQQRMRNARSNLHAAMAALNMRIGGQQARHIALQVQTISLIQAGTSPATARITQNARNATPPISEDRDGVKPSMSLECIRRRPSADQQDVSHIRIKATTNLTACPKFCPCGCHVTTYLQTPVLLRNLFGQLLLSYTGLIRTTPCDYPPCRKAKTKNKFT